MPNEAPKQNNLLQYAIIAALAYWIYTGQQQQPAPLPTPTPDPKPAVVNVAKATSGVLAEVKAANARIFNEAASKVESGAIKTDEQLLDFVKPATQAARESANKQFDLMIEMSLPRNADGSFAGKEAEVAKLLRQVARSW